MGEITIKHPEHTEIKIKLGNNEIAFFRLHLITKDYNVTLRDSLELETYYTKLILKLRSGEIKNLNNFVQYFIKECEGYENKKS